MGLSPRLLVVEFVADSRREPASKAISRGASEQEELSIFPAGNVQVLVTLSVSICGRAPAVSKSMTTGRGDTRLGTTKAFFQCSDLALVVRVGGLWNLMRPIIQDCQRLHSLLATNQRQTLRCRLTVATSVAVNTVPLVGFCEAKYRLARDWPSTARSRSSMATGDNTLVEGVDAGG